MGKRSARTSTSPSQSRWYGRKTLEPRAKSGCPILLLRPRYGSNLASPTSYHTMGEEQQLKFLFSSPHVMLAGKSSRIMVAINYRAPDLARGSRGLRPCHWDWEREVRIMVAINNGAATLHGGEPGRELNENCCPILFLRPRYDENHAAPHARTAAPFFS